MSRQRSKKPEISEEQLRKSRVAVARFHEVIGRVLRKQEFAVPGDVEKHMNEIISGKRKAPPPETKLEIAQEMVFDAWEETNPERKVAIARKALAISEDCADAWVILAENAKSPAEERELLESAVKAGERAIGPECFKEDAGHFWGVHGTRPYMRARHGLAWVLWAEGEKQKAIEHLQDMLRLNPGDNQALRYDLSGWLVVVRDQDALHRLLDEYKDDNSAALEYARAILAFRREGDSDNARKRLRAAYKANHFVVQYLLGLKTFSKQSPETVTVGGESEGEVTAAGLVQAFAEDRPLAEWFLDFMAREHKPDIARLRKQLFTDMVGKSDYPFAESPVRRAMSESPPTLEEWRRLYDAAIRFQALEAWKSFYDMDLFGVMNPETREIGYCSIMGNLGTFFALGVYKGSEGFVAYNQTLAAGLKNEPREAIFNQNCLMAQFEPPDEIEDQDREVMRRLGWVVPASHLAPMFRSHRPGFMPWFVNTDEARFLTYALEQAVDVVTRFRESTRELESKPGPAFLTRVPEVQPDGTAWHDAWLVPVVPELEPKPRDFPLNEVRLTKVKRAGYPTAGVWEADFAYSLAPIQEKRGKRPYFPYLYLIADHAAKMIITINVGEPDTVVLSLREQFLNACEKVQALPSEVQVRTAQARRILEPLASNLGITISQVKNLPVVENIHAQMEKDLEDEDGFFSK